MSSANIAERSQVAKLHKNRPALVSTHRHSGFEQHVGPGLTSELSLVWRIVFSSERSLEPSFVIRRKENYNRVCPREGNIQYLPNVRRCLDSLVKTRFEEVPAI